MPTKKTALAKPTPSDVAETSKQVHPRVQFIRSVKFAGLGLDSVSAKTDRNAVASAKQAEKSLFNDVTINQSLLAFDEDHFIVRAVLKVVQHVEGSPKPLVQIEAAFTAKFNLASPFDKSFVEAFAQVEARLVFFPYMRHLVSDITYRMSVDPIVLPLSSEL